MHPDVAKFLQDYGWLTGELAWLLYAIPAALAVHTETSGLTLSRHRYAINCVFRAVGALILFQLAIALLDTLNAIEGEYSFTRRISLIALLVAIYIFAVTFVVVRIVVQRLRDAAIAQKWAYLMLLPGVGQLLLLVLVLYPPSRAPTVPRTRLEQVIHGSEKQAAD